MIKSVLILLINFSFLGEGGKNKEIQRETEGERGREKRQRETDIQTGRQTDRGWYSGIDI